MKNYVMIILLSFALSLFFISCGDESPDSTEESPDSTTEHTDTDKECSENGKVKSKKVDECKYKQSCDKLGSQNITWQECTDGKWIMQQDAKSCGERQVDAQCEQLPSTGLESMTEQERLDIGEAELPERGILPLSHDLSSMFPPVKSQGSQGSCVSWAAGYYIKSYQEKLEKNWNFSSLDNLASHVMSPAFIYNYHHKGDSSCKNKGMTLYSAANILKEKGIAKWLEMPYDQKVCSVGPDDSVLEKAKANKIDSFKRTHISNFKTFLASNIPILIGVDVYSNFQSCFKHSKCMKEYTAAGSVLKSVQGSTNGGHAIVVVGYSDTKKAYKIINSWGTYWGDNGFLWISYQVFSKILKRHGSTGYILVDHIDNPCENVDCTENGSCEITAQKTPYCICDSGYKPENLTCIKCKSQSYKQCKDGNIFWFNSCGETESVASTCVGDSKCQNVSSTNAKCTNTCTSQANKGCYDGQIYWLDSCGNREELTENCSENSSCAIVGGVAKCYCDSGYAPDGDSCTAIDSNVSVDDEGNYLKESASHNEWKSLLAINCRSGAGTNNSVVTVLAKNDKIKSLNDYAYDSNDSIWFKFENESGKKCYVRARNKYIEPLTSTACTTKANKGCYNQDLYWFDSCGNKEDLVKSCTDHTTCGINNGTADCYCESGYNMNESGSCEKKETVVSYDSDGNYTKESAQHKQWESLVSINCRSGAGTNNSVVTVLSKNDRLESLDDYKYDSNNSIWFKFRNEGGKECYVRARNKYLKAINSTGCTTKSDKGCYNKNLYWYDSCGNKGQLAKSCSSDTTCEVKDGTAGCYSKPDDDDVITITTFPYNDTRNTEDSERRKFNPTSGVCKPSSGSEAGAEYVYKVTIESNGTLTANITDEKSGDQIDIDIHLLKEGTEQEHCIARDNKKVSKSVEPGTYYLILDTYTSSDDEKAGEYDLKVEFSKQGDNSTISTIANNPGNDCSEYLKKEPTVPFAANSTLNNPTQALLTIIGGAEGLNYCYNYSVTYKQFYSFADHPRKSYTWSSSGSKSTAAGRYQFLSSTWDGINAKHNYPNFEPENQDLGAIVLIKDYKKVKNYAEKLDIIEFSQAIFKLAPTWASLPKNESCQGYYGGQNAKHCIEYLWKQYKQLTGQ